MPVNKVTVSKSTIENLKKKLQQLKEPVSAQTANKLGKLVVAEMKDMISKGISPVGTGDRFDGYLAVSRVGKITKIAKSLSGSRKASAKAKISQAKKGYPYNTKEFRKGQKGIRPVNLKLTGDFLRDLSSKIRSIKGSYVTDIGYSNEKQKKKEQGHRESAGGQPSRPTIPTTQEGFAQRIQRIISSVYREHIRDLLKK